MASPNPTTSPLDLINAALGLFSKHLQGLDKTLGSTAAAAIKVQIGLQFFTHVLEKAISSLGSQFTRFVQLANPATVIRFNRAMENFASALGQVLTPVLEKLTPIVQAMGNAIASLDEPTKKLLGGLALGSALATSFAAVAAAIAAIVAILGGWVAVLIALGSAVAGMVIMSEDGKKVMESFSGILKMFGNVLQIVAKPISSLLLKIGEAIAPILAAFEPLVEALGELAGALIEIVSGGLVGFLGVVKMLTPVIGQIVKVFSGVIRIVSTLIQIVVKLTSETMMQLVRVIGQFVEPAITALVEALKWMVDRLVEMVNWLRRQANLEEIKPFDPDKNRAQAVVKQASIGDVQSFLKRAYEQSATGSGATIEKQQLDKLGQINTGIADLGKIMAEAMRNWHEGKPGNAPASPLPMPQLPHNPLPQPKNAFPRPPLDLFGAPGGLWSAWRKAF